MSAELWPVNAETLLKRGGAKFIYRPERKDILASCPFCGGRLLIDESLPNWVCLGAFTCVSGKKNFQELITALAEVKP
jgi:hypothetical protein